MYTSICENIQLSLQSKVKSDFTHERATFSSWYRYDFEQTRRFAEHTARPYESCKNIRAGPSKMPLRCWYNCDTNHFDQADFCLAEMNKPTMSSNKSSTACSCAENQIFVGFLRIKSSEQDFKNLY